MSDYWRDVISPSIIDLRETIKLPNCISEPMYGNKIDLVDRVEIAVSGEIPS